MDEANFDAILEVILTKDSRYSRDAYHFLRDALNFTQGAITKEKRGERHVTGQQLLDGIRQYSLQQFGPMTITVFEEWGIHGCKDFGELVFNMVENGFLTKTDRDSREDFQNGYDFNDAFRKPYWPESRLKKEKAHKPPTVKKS